MSDEVIIGPNSCATCGGEYGEHAEGCSSFAAPSGSVSVRPKTFQESARCPVCLTVGEMRFQYGNYCCDRCDQCWRPDTLNHWMKAFEQGREFERQNDQAQRPGLTAGVERNETKGKSDEQQT